MEIVHGDFTSTTSLAILPGSFHPPTIAHLGLARAALQRVDQVLFTLPRAFPHKRYEGVAQLERLALLEHLTAGEPRFLVAVSEGGLFVEMAREARRLLPGVDVFLACGRDAAERILSWPYPEDDAIERQLEHYRLLVAGRQGAFVPPPALAPRVETLETPAAWDEVSSTAVRNAIDAGQPWRHLVPPPLHSLVETLYSPSRFDSRNVRNR